MMQVPAVQNIFQERYLRTSEASHLKRRKFSAPENSDTIFSLSDNVANLDRLKDNFLKVIFTKQVQTTPARIVSSLLRFAVSTWLFSSNKINSFLFDKLQQ